VVNGGQVLEINNGIVTLSGGNLSAASTVGFTLDSNSKVTIVGTNKLTLNFKLATGLFKGTFREPGGTRKLNFKGAVLQKANNGSGFFLDTDRSGRAVIQSVP
jgi:hypothetical protein